MIDQDPVAGGETPDPSVLSLAADRTIALVEDDEMVRSWVRLALDRSEFRLVGEAATAADAHDLVVRRRPALLLVDQRLPDGTGTELVRDLRHRGVAAPALVMTANRAVGFNELVRDAGAQGSVLKSGNVRELLDALRTIAEGGRVIDPRHPPRAVGRAALSPREREVLRHVARGLTNRQIAEEMNVGTETVKTLVARSFAKLGVSRRAEAVAAAHERGLL